MSTCTVDSLREAVRELMPQIQADLEHLVRIPSCAFAGFPREPVREAAEEKLQGKLLHYREQKQDLVVILNWYKV
jgi:hypothetical protein